MAPTNGGDYDFFGGSAGPAQPPPPSGAPAPTPATTAQFGSFGSPPASGGFAPPSATVPLSRSMPTIRSGKRRRSRPPKQLVTLVVIAAIVGGSVFLFKAGHGADRIAYIRTTVSLPDEAGAYTHNIDPSIAQLESEHSEIAGGYDVQATQVGVYNLTSAGQPAAIVVAAKFKHVHVGKTGDKDGQFGAAVAKSSGGVFGAFTTLQSGKLGGTVECGNGTVNGAQMRICGAVDSAAVVSMIFLDPKVPDATVIAMREAVEHR